MVLWPVERANRPSGSIRVRQGKHFQYGVGSVEYEKASSHRASRHGSLPSATDPAGLDPRIRRKWRRERLQDGMGWAKRQTTETENASEQR